MTFKEMCYHFDRIAASVGRVIVYVMVGYTLTSLLGKMGLLLAIIFVFVVYLGSDIYRGEMKDEI